MGIKKYRILCWFQKFKYCVAQWQNAPKQFKVKNFFKENKLWPNPIFSLTRFQFFMGNILSLGNIYIVEISIKFSFFTPNMTYFKKKTFSSMRRANFLSFIRIPIQGKNTQNVFLHTIVRVSARVKYKLMGFMVYF